MILSDRRKDGTYNAKIRITHQRKSRYIKTPFYLTADQLTRTGKIKDALVNDKIEQEVRRYRNAINELGFVCDGLDVDELLVLLKAQDGSYDFFSYADNYLVGLKKEGREGTQNVLVNALRKLEAFNGSRSLPFSRMTVRLINEWHESLKDAGYKPVYIRNVLAMIQGVYNDARRKLNDQSNGRMVVMWDCFSGVTVESDNRVTRRAFDSVSQMQSVIDCPYREGDATFELYKDMFVFSFVCFGINYADIVLLRKKDISKEGILTFNRKKVSRRMGDRSIIKIRLCDVAKAIIAKHSTNDSEWLFPALRRRKSMRPSKYMSDIFEDAGLPPGYVFYTARHSMATFARNLCGIDMFIVNEMLDHAPPSSMKMTDVYIKRDYKPLWDANDKLLNLFNWDFYLK